MQLNATQQKRNKLMMDANTWMNIKNIMQSEKREIKATYYVIPFLWCYEKTETQDYRSVDSSSVVGKEWSLTPKMCEGTFWSDGNTIYFDSASGYTST